MSNALENFDEEENKLIQTLRDDKQIGFLWKSKLRSLLYKGKITEDEHERFVELHQSNTKKTNDTAKNKMKELATNIKDCVCKDCGKVLHSGTYGMIYESKKNENRIIKGNVSKKTVDGEKGCDALYEKEYDIYTKLKTFQQVMKIVSLVNITRNWVENGRCYLEMEKIKPIVLTKSQILECKNVSLCQYENQKFLKKLMEEKFIFMLVPRSDYEYFTSGGNSWIEIGDFGISLYLHILGISKADYYNELNVLLKYCFQQKIGLVDVEFILGSVNGKNGIYMIDFDKVQEKKNKDIFSFQEKKVINEQDMFPFSLSYKIQGYNTTLDKNMFKAPNIPAFNTRSKTMKKKKTYYGMTTRSKTNLNGNKINSFNKSNSISSSSDSESQNTPSTPIFDRVRKTFKKKSGPKIRSF